MKIRWPVTLTKPTVIELIEFLQTCPPKAKFHAFDQWGNFADTFIFDLDMAECKPGEVNEDGALYMESKDSTDVEDDSSSTTDFYEGML